MKVNGIDMEEAFEECVNNWYESTFGLGYEESDVAKKLKETIFKSGFYTALQIIINSRQTIESEKVRDPHKV